MVVECRRERGLVGVGSPFEDRRGCELGGDECLVHPVTGQRIDEPGRIPDVYRGADPYVMDFERDLWSNFWKLADDEGYRKATGVRVAQGEAVSTKFQPDRLYTVTLESDGGLNIVSSPLKGIYREALKRDAVN